MTYEAFIESVNTSDTPPADLTDILKSLWYAQKGDWERSHNIAQEIHNRDGSWVHANLHREEGDLGNARYWYNRADRPESRKSVAEEREELIRHFLGE